LFCLLLSPAPHHPFQIPTAPIDPCIKTRHRLRERDAGPSPLHHPSLYRAVPARPPIPYLTRLQLDKTRTEASADPLRTSLYPLHHPSIVP
jgi:hypothetical protein